VARKGHGASSRRKSTEDKLRELDEISGIADRSEQTARLRAALEDRHCRVVAKAASLTAAALHYDLVPALVEAFSRFVDVEPKRDPGCLAKNAIVRALVELDCDDVELFLAGLRCRQLEPVYGGSVDTAADVRAACASGLVATGYPRALIEVTELLADPEPHARIGAVRAIACGTPREAALLLRAKALYGDEEPTVVGECFSGLLAVEPDESLPFVARFLGAGNAGEIRELAALALGESRLPAAVRLLIDAWSDVLPDRAFRRALIRAAGLHRSDDACEWLLQITAEADAQWAESALDALSTLRRNPRLTERVRAAVEARRDPQLAERFERLWTGGAAAGEQ